MSLYPDVPYEYAASAAGLLFTAGACPLDEDGKVVAGGLEAQAHRALDNLLAVLGERKIVKTTVYVVARGQDDLLRAWRVVEKRLAPARPPSTLVGVSLLGYTGQLFEIEAVAAE